MKLQPRHRPRIKNSLLAAGATLVCALGASVLLTAGFPAAGPEDAPKTLPTPFSAAEIRAGWPEGFWLDTKTTSAQGERIGRTIVTGWGEDEVTMIEVVIEEGEEPSPEQMEAAQSVTMSWAELEGHARFDASRTTRQRAQHSTALGGGLEGWLYRVRGADGAESVFFFADDFPGPPVLYWQENDGEKLFVAEQIDRKPVG